MGNQPSQQQQQQQYPHLNSAASAASGDVGVRSATILNRRSSNTGATTVSSCASPTTTTTSSTASSSPSLSHHNNTNTRNQQSQQTSSSGNFHTSGGIGNINIRNVFQQLHIKHGQSNSNNALGITRTELDERCKPSGLYSTCHWDDKAIRRLIGDGKLASRQQWDAEKNGIELDADHHECPICFFTYPQMNATKCCQANICTECYLQLQPYQKPNINVGQNKPIVMNAKSQQNACPFCNTAKLMVKVGPMKQIQSQQPEQPMTALPISKDSTDEQPESNPNSHPTSATPTSGFGSSLEQNSRVAMMRARSCSIASEHSHSSSTTTSVKEQQEMVSQAAMTIQERQQIEEEMRAQHLHPLALKIEQEEMERRLKNQLQYYSQHQQRNVQHQTSAVPASSSGHQPIPRRNQLYPTPPPLPQQHQRHVPPMVPPSISNILFLQHPLRAAPPSSSPSPSLAVRGLSEEEQIALAIEASLRDSGTTRTTN